MIEPIILAQGRFASSDLTVTTAPSNRAVDPNVERQLQTTWQAMLEKAKKEGRVLFNGMSYRLNSLREHDGKLDIELASFEYKVRDGLLNTADYWNLPEPYYRKGCYTAATVRTKDGRYLLAELSGKSMNNNAIETLGGIIDAEPVITDGEGIFASLYNELNEEALIVPSDIDHCYLRAAYVERRTNVGLYFEVQLKVTAGEILARHTESSLDPEIKKVIALEREDYIATLNSHNSNKHLIAKLLTL